MRFIDMMCVYSGLIALTRLSIFFSRLTWCISTRCFEPHTEHGESNALVPFASLHFRRFIGSRDLPSVSSSSMRASPDSLSTFLVVYLPLTDIS